MSDYTGTEAFTMFTITFTRGWDVAFLSIDAARASVRLAGGANRRCQKTDVVMMNHVGINVSQ